MTTPQRSASVPRSRGFTLMEMLMVIALLGAFTLLEADLFRSSIKIVQESRHQELRDARRGDFVRNLRADVWSSRRMTVAHAQAVLLEEPDGSSVTWSWDAENLRMIRQVSRDGRRIQEEAWPDPGFVPVFEAQPPVLLLRAADTGTDRSTPVVLPSQLQIAGVTTP